MGLMEQIKIDVQAFTSNKNDFGVDLTFISPSNQTVTVAGYYSDHSMAFDEMGNPVVGRKIPVAVSEQSLIDAGYQSVRNSKGLITFAGHKIVISYADGQTITYVIDEWQPDYTINLITLFMTAYV